MEKHCFTADIEHEDQRIDRYLTEMLLEQSRFLFSEADQGWLCNSKPYNCKG